MRRGESGAVPDSPKKPPSDKGRFFCLWMMPAASPRGDTKEGLIMGFLKIVFIIVGSLAAALMIFGGWYFIRMKHELDTMRPLDTQELVPGIYAIKDDHYINMFLVKADAGYVAIDAAHHEDQVKREMARLNIDPAMVRAVLLTHSDYDHVGAVHLFSNATVYLPAAEEQMANGKTARAALIHHNTFHCPYQLIADNQVLDITGLKVKGILTPGHTPGSTCYLINDEYLFTGDTLKLEDRKAVVFNEFFNMDTAAQKNSIAKLAGLTGIKYLFTDHYGYSDTKVFEDWGGTLA